MSGKSRAQIHADLRGFFYILGLLLVALFTAPVAAQDVITDDEVNAIADDLFCPTCENTPLDACPTQACADWRAEIRQQLAQGRTEAEIRQYFVDRYGVQVLAEPPQRGFHLLVWLLPILAVTVGAIVFSRYLRAIQKPDALTKETPTVTIAEEGYLAQIERELQK